MRKKKKILWERKRKDTELETNLNKKDTTQIRSESAFVWKFILQILISPVIFILFLCKKKKWSDVSKPWNDFFAFIFEPKVTITLIFLNIACFIAQVLISPEHWASLITYPTDLWLRPYTIITAGFLHASIVHLLEIGRAHV